MTLQLHPTSTTHLPPGIGRLPADERTPWGWLRWSSPTPDAAPVHLLQIAIRTPEPSLRAQCAHRWLTRRPPIRLYLDHGGSVTAAALLTAVCALIGMSWAIDHGLPVSVALPLAILLPLLVDHLPARLDTRARTYVRIVDTAPGLEYLQKLTAQHIRLVRAYTANPGTELDYAVQIGHRVLWAIATITTASDCGPDTTCRLLTLESLMDHLTRQIDDVDRARGALDAPIEPATVNSAPTPRTRGRR